jgi:bacterioferritin-associated ferredoxin
MGLTFEHLKAVAVREGLSFEQLRERTGCSTGCTTCEPYVRLMIKTGCTDFPVLSADQVREVMRDAAPGTSDRGGVRAQPGRSGE